MDKTAPNTMTILLEYRSSINRYCKEITASAMDIPCPCCNRRLRRHSNKSKTRDVVTKIKIYRIPIIRLRCPKCDKTFSLIPSFIAPYNSYANYIRELIGRWLLSGVSLVHLLQCLCAIRDIPIVSLRSLYRWKRQWWRRFDSWFLSTRSRMAADYEFSRVLLDLYRHGMDSKQERSLVFDYFLGTHVPLPRVGNLLSAFNLHVPLAERW
jgi:hypothetical protein